MGSDDDDHHSKGYELVFKNICVRIGKRDILHDVNGLAKPGEMIAIMGPSGAGKTTLLNCLANRREIDSGVITMNSRLINKRLRRKISFVLQNDLFLSHLTCWETIWYTALLRLPGSMPVEEKKKKVFDIIDALDMRKCLDTRVGEPGHAGLSGGERKRTTIACELLTNPALMLLDEPTSGLDSTTAYSLCLTIKKFAKLSNKTVIMTIHQPSSQIFRMFDKLLLLCDGQVAYYGDLKRCANYFTSIDLPCPANYNLADHILDQVKDTEEIKSKIIERAIKQREEEWYPDQLKTFHSIGNNVVEHSPLPETDVLLSVRNGDCNHLTASQMNGSMTLSIASGYHDNEKFSSCDLELGMVKFGNDDLDEDDELRFRKEYDAKWPTSFWMQYSVLVKRSFWQAFPQIMSKWNILQVLITAIFGGLLWFKIEPKEEALSDRCGMIFFTLIYPAFGAVVNSMLSFPAERLVLNKERLAGYYRLSAYYCAKLTSDVPLILILPIIFVTITYWMSAINLQFSVFLQMMGSNLLSVLLAQGLGMFFSCLILELPVSIMCSVTTMLVLTLAGGFYAKSVPFWIEWLKYASFIQHTYYSLLTIDFRSGNITCAAVGSRYPECFGENSTSEHALYIPQQALLDDFTLSSRGFSIWHHLLIVTLLMLLSRVACYIVLRYIRKPHIV